MPDAMTPPSAVLVSHGQPSDPAVAETELAELAAQVAPHLPGWALASATLATPGRLVEVTAQAGPGALVFPVFMTDGWFIRTALPDRLRGVQAHILPPLGTAVALADLAASTLADILAQRGQNAGGTSLVVAAHGSGRSANAARDTELFASRVTARLRFATLRLGYVEQAPFLADALTGLDATALCLPFFAARRGHVLEDLPEAIEQSGFTGTLLDPVGLWRGVPDLIAAALLAAQATRTGGGSAV